MIRDTVSPSLVRGSVRAGCVLPGRSVRADLRRDRNGKAKYDTIALPGVWVFQQPFDHNTILYDWTVPLGELLRGAPDGKLYKIGGMYLEFENNGGAAVTPPTVTRDGGLAYYNGLADSATRDYLRVPATAVLLSSSDDLIYPDGNRITTLAHTTGTVGVHGKPFSAAAQSRVYGGALVAYPDYEDAAQDRLISRRYFGTSDDQLVKLVGAEIGLEWRLDLQ